MQRARLQTPPQRVTWTTSDWSAARQAGMQQVTQAFVRSASFCQTCTGSSMALLLSTKTWPVKPGSMHTQILILKSSASCLGQWYCHHEAAVTLQLEPNIDWQ